MRYSHILLAMIFVFSFAGNPHSKVLNSKVIIKSPINKVPKKEKDFDELYRILNDEESYKKIDEDLKKTLTQNLIHIIYKNEIYYERQIVAFFLTLIAYSSEWIWGEDGVYAQARQAGSTKAMTEFIGAPTEVSNWYLRFFDEETLARLFSIMNTEGAKTWYAKAWEQAKKETTIHKLYGVDKVELSKVYSEVHKETYELGLRKLKGKNPSEESLIQLGKKLMSLRIHQKLIQLSEKDFETTYYHILSLLPSSIAKYNHPLKNANMLKEYVRVEHDINHFTTWWLDSILYLLMQTPVFLTFQAGTLDVETGYFQSPQDVISKIRFYFVELMLAK